MSEELDQALDELLAVGRQYMYHCNDTDLRHRLHYALLRTTRVLEEDNEKAKFPSKKRSK